MSELYNYLKLNPDKYKGIVQYKYICVQKPLRVNACRMKFMYILTCVRLCVRVRR